jgi:hypothetical protein
MEFKNAKSIHELLYAEKRALLLDRIICEIKRIADELQFEYTELGAKIRGELKGIHRRATMEHNPAFFGPLPFFMCLDCP